MIGREAYREILEEDYRRHRVLAENYRSDGDATKAATHYRNGAELLEELADEEPNETLAERRRDLAENFRAAAEAMARKGDRSGDATRTVSADAGRPAASDEAAPSARRGVPGGSRTVGPATGGTPEEALDASSILEPVPDLDFDDIGGMDGLKRTLIEKIVDPLERRELYEEYRLGVVNGVLLYGPPGTGKTYVTRALAGKLGWNFVVVSTADVVSKYVGEAAQHVSEIFEVARANQPCLVFLDEIEAIASKRDGDMTSSERQMVNQLLQELSAIQGSEVVVVAATNALDLVDDAIKRSGRFDERIEVPLPDGTARVEILKVHLRNRPVLPDAIDWDWFERESEGYTGSDIELVATNAARQALKEAVESGDIRPVTQTHLAAALAETEPSASRPRTDGGRRPPDDDGSA